MTGKLVLAFILSLTICVLVASKENLSDRDFQREQSVRDCSREVSYSRHYSRDLALPGPRAWVPVSVFASHGFFHSTTCSFGVSPLPASASARGAFDDNDVFPETSFWKVQISSRVFC